MVNDATKAQNIAADPTASTWLSANAGSGKTRVLTNRVARLLLHGVQPQNILCLTYTKAAANEMQNRLFKTLGAWAMLDEATLRKSLTELGEVPPENLSKARTLFASAIEAPGGLKVQTIHSLCSSILRQFPLEAGVSPQFRELDEADQKQLIAQVLNDLADTNSAVLSNLSLFSSGETLDDLAASVAKHAEDFTSSLSHAEIFSAFGVPAGQTEDDILSIAFQDGDLPFLRSLAPYFLNDSKPTNRGTGGKLAKLPESPSIYALFQAASFLLTGKSKSPYTAKVGSLPTKDLRNDPEFVPFLPRLETIMTQVEKARSAWVPHNAAHCAIALHDFAAAFLPAYSNAKESIGALDFDDLILKTRGLLTDQTLPWVLFRLDSRIEHVLVDEAQDTSQAQWDIIRALAEELTSGNDPASPRTLFVVGDKKQSIYSFQGADAESFDRMSQQFGTQLAGQLRHHELAHSFRSSPAILQAVDAVFEGSGINAGGDAVRHLAFHKAMPGRVDLWPLEPRPDKLDEPEWYMPVDRPVANSPSVVLSEKLAQSIKYMIENETIPGENGGFRAIQPRDIMILVRGRGSIFGPLIRACKSIDLDIAGADRLKIAAEMAVRDVVALLSFLALPDDSLSLASALKSPLFGFSEKQLFDLAAERQGRTLWDEIRRRQDDYPEAHHTLRSLRDLVDFARPYELIETILTQHDGRRKLVAHIGAEAEDGIDELLNQALAYERDTVPSLTGFLAKFHVEDIEIKRQADGSDNLIRVMTVHGAKGLERPIVILPDTTSAPKAVSGDILPDEDGMPVLPQKTEINPERIENARSARSEADRAERDRLLYVAMTRAEKWLIVCGIEPRNPPKTSLNWYQTVEAGLRRAGGGDVDTAIGPITRLQSGDWSDVPTIKESERKGTVPAVLPSFFSDGPVTAPEFTPVFSPSDLGGEKVLPGSFLTEEQALKRGRQIHLLLEHLPGVSDPDDRARRLLASGPDRADEADLPELVNEAVRNLTMHANLFSGDALAEVDVTAHLPELNAKISGTIDRLIVTETKVTAVDFKTNAIVPDRPEMTPDGVLRQMGAYLSALEQIYPDTPVELAILWTASCQLMPLPHGIVREALGRATTS